MISVKEGGVEYGRFPTKHWGMADTKEVLAEGIIHYTTPSHGGVELSMPRLMEMPEKYRALSWTGDNCFEEDCSWIAVALTWPALYSSEHLEIAKRIAASTYKIDACQPA